MWYKESKGSTWGEKNVVLTNVKVRVKVSGRKASEKRVRIDRG
jgi:hypothetical protein